MLLVFTAIVKLFHVTNFVPLKMSRKVHEFCENFVSKTFAELSEIFSQEFIESP